MKIELVPCYLDRELFLRLAKDYIETLHEYDSSIIWDEGAMSHMIWDAQFIMEDRTIQGFIISEDVKFAVYKDVKYIAEFYVAPEARRRGVGIEAVKALLENWDGDVFLYILHGNFEGRAFWSAVEQKLGWRRIDRPEIRKEEGCELMVYEIDR